MSRVKTEVSVFWVHGTPYVERHYYTWESKRTPRIIYDPQDGTYTKKSLEWRGKNKERYANKINETWQARFIRDLEQIQTLIYSKYTRPMRLSKEETERLLDWLDEEE